jgi:hypothetical protein
MRKQCKRADDELAWRSEGSCAETSSGISSLGNMRSRDVGRACVMDIVSIIDMVVIVSSGEYSSEH